MNSLLVLSHIVSAVVLLKNYIMSIKRNQANKHMKTIKKNKRCKV